MENSELDSYLSKYYLRVNEFELDSSLPYSTRLSITPHAHPWPQMIYPLILASVPFFQHQSNSPRMAAFFLFKETSVTPATLFT